MFQHAVRTFFTPEGAQVQARALVLFPPDVSVRPGDVVERDGVRYRVVSVEEVTYPPVGYETASVPSHVEVWVA